MTARSRRARADRSAREADEALLGNRLRGLGLTHPVEVHENSTVLVSVTGRGVLRIHRGYAYASDRTLQEVLTFVSPRAKRLERGQAQQGVAAFPVEDFVVVRRRRRTVSTRPEDRPLLRRLRELHDQLNTAHFGGTLSNIPLRISNRMRTRLGELTVDARTNQAVEIAVSRRHVEHDAWDEVIHTVLHEMVHQWQAESGMEIDHGPEFRRKARAVGVLPRAHRTIIPRTAASTLAE
jgi:hypothetical protein